MNSGGPGAGAGTERLYRVGDVYVTLSPDFGLGEPCATLDEALGGIFVSGATREIWCSELTEEEIIARMQRSGMQFVRDCELALVPIPPPP